MQRSTTLARRGVKALISRLPGFKPHAEAIFPPAFARYGLVRGRVARRTLMQTLPKNTAHLRPFFRRGLRPAFTQGALFFALHLRQRHQRSGENSLIVCVRLCRNG